MARFDLYRTPEVSGYLLDVQADALSHLNTRMVIPLLRPPHAPQPARILNPVFNLDGTAHVLATQYMAAIESRHLKSAAGSLADHRHEITQAIDLLLQGF